MLVLSLDIDFFVCPKKYDSPTDSIERLPSHEYCVEDLPNVRSFLEDRCCLSANHKVPGAFMRHHTQGFDVVEELHRRAAHGIDLINVDAHADLGSGDSGWHYLLTEWLPIPAGSRPKPKRGYDGLNLGNWMAFVGAAGFLNSLTYVPNIELGRGPDRGTPGDICRCYLRDEDSAPQLYFCPISAGEVREWGAPRLKELLKLKEPAAVVPFTLCDREDLRLDRRPDYVFVCQSPGYTPVEADEILDLVGDYIQLDSLGLTLEPPVR